MRNPWLRRCVLLLLCIAMLIPSVMADEPAQCDHDYTLAAYQAPRHRAEGFERYRCTKCGDEYEIILARIPEEEPVWSYDSLSNATSGTLTVFVGYYGMSYQKKIVLTVDEIIQNCDMEIQSFSYINRRPRVCYAVGYGPYLRDVLEYAGVDTGSIQAFQFGTADSGGNFYNQQEWTYSSLYRSRYFYPELSVYFQADGSFSDSAAARENMQRVKPMLAVWSCWKTYDIGEEFSLADHSGSMSADSCFRLLYGQTQISESAANTSAKWCNAIFVRYAGTPDIDAGGDVTLSVQKNKNGYQLSASIRAADSQLTKLFADAAFWSSSDETVVRVDRTTGKLTVVGTGTATITVTSKVGDITVYDTLKVTVSDDGENTGTGGSGGGTGGGDGSGSGSGSGSGTGEPGKTGETGSSGAGENGGSAPERPTPTDPSQSSLSTEPQQSDASLTENPPTSDETHLRLEPGEAPKPSRGTLQRIQTPGASGEGNSGGGGTEVSVLLSDRRLLLLTALAALALLLLGAVWKYLQYRKQTK